jgi:hypothetical protein
VQLLAVIPDYNTMYNEAHILSEILWCGYPVHRGVQISEYQTRFPLSFVFNYFLPEFPGLQEKQICCFKDLKTNI